MNLEHYANESACRSLPVPFLVPFTSVTPFPPHALFLNSTKEGRNEQRLDLFSIPSKSQSLARIIATFPF